MMERTRADGKYTKAGVCDIRRKGSNDSKNEEATKNSDYI